MIRKIVQVGTETGERGGGGMRNKKDHDLCEYTDGYIGGIYRCKTVHRLSHARLFEIVKCVRV